MLSLIWSHMLCPAFPMLFSQLSCVSMLLPTAALFLSAWSHKIPLFLPYTKVVQMGKAMQTLSILGVPKVPKLFMLRMWNLANQWNPFTWKKKQSFEVWMQPQVIHRIHIILSRYDLFLTYPNHGKSIKTSNWFPHYLIINNYGTTWKRIVCICVCVCVCVCYVNFWAIPHYWH